MIRNANINDIRAITGLHYMAGPNIFKFFFATEDKAELISILELLYNTNNNIFSKDNFFVFEEEKQLKGIISLYNGKEKKRLETNALKHIFKIYKIYGIKRLTKILYRLIFNDLSPKFNSDELYIHAISVFPQFRGQKVASRLLQYAFNKAKELNVPNVALLVELQNKHAINVYKKYGFSIVSTQKFNSELEKYNLYGVHKMIAKVN